MLRLDINLLWTIINLLILYVLLRLFLFKPVRNILAKRKAEIQKSYDDAAAVQKDADALKAQYEASMQGIEAQKAAAADDARRKAGEEYDRILAEAHSEADQVLENAQQQADATVNAAKGRADEEIAAMARDVLAKAAVAGSDQKLYDEFLNQVASGQPADSSAADEQQ